MPMPLLPASPPPENPPQASSQPSSAETALETRLSKLLDDYMNEIKDALRSQDKKIDRQGEKLDRLAEDRVTRDEYDALRRRVDTQATEVAVHGQRLQALESVATADETSRRTRPALTWQLVLATIAVLVSLFFNSVMTVIMVVTLFLKR